MRGRGRKEQVPEAGERMDRRELLRKGAALAAGAAAAGIAGQAGVASAATGDDVVAGEQNTATSETTIERSDIAIGSSFGYRGAASGSWGVQGLNNAPATGAPASGYAGDAGVFGDTSNAAVVGVLGRNQSTGSAVKGTSDDGVGVLAESANGSALRVYGRAVFDQAGRRVLPRGQRYVNVVGPAVSTRAAILVTINSNTNVTVRHAFRTGANSFAVVFNGRARRDTAFSYFVIN
ncbi:MAG: hypothetical protein C4521_13820 [Actinobacteria bacterium]|nr:MAG: hypothetical protein C4521_13820 [Actinomycetota bacterium]